jgi:hypothetical protein
MCLKMRWLEVKLVCLLGCPMLVSMRVDVATRSFWLVRLVGTFRNNERAL